MSNSKLVSCTADYANINIAVESSKNQRAIVDRLKAIANGLSDRENLPIFRILTSQAGYGYAIKLPLFSNLSYRLKNEEVPHIRIYAAPFSSSRSFFRFELKGHPLEINHRLCARLWLECIFGANGKKYLTLKNMRLTAGDLAIDVNAPITALTMELNQSQKSGAFWGNTGILETFYNGKRSSNGYLCAYSRDAKLSEKNKTIPWKGVRTRIEVRLKFRRFLSDSEFCNPLSKVLCRLNIYDLSKIKESEVLTPWFVELTKTIGLKPLLNHFSADDKRRIRRAIKPFKVEELPKRKLIQLGQEAFNELRELAVDFQVDQELLESITYAFLKCYSFSRKFLDD